MAKNSFPALTAVFSREYTLKDRIDHNQLNILSTVLIGLSQLPLAFSFPAQSLWPRFVILCGGSLLVGIGISAYIGEGILQDGGESDEEKWMSSVIILIFAISVVAAAISVAVA
ncbi:hypothetical protein [Halococcus hamelinensis]|uniref:hypothetical protein n=2 Tax=Halococcus hamelinensis TaxID=332168 RepID=UPI000AEED431|nr:hypothetical protein [Halococcus hamelinensis]